MIDFGISYDAAKRVSSNMSDKLMKGAYIGTPSLAHMRAERDAYGAGMIVGFLLAIGFAILAAIQTARADAAIAALDRAYDLLAACNAHCESDARDGAPFAMEE